MLEAITTSIELGKPCAAICHGPWMFCSARFPNGQPVCHQRQCTSFVAIKDDLINAGAQFVDAPVVVDGPLITARTPADLIPLLPRAHRGALAGRACDIHNTGAFVCSTPNSPAT